MAPQYLLGRFRSEWIWTKCGMAEAIVDLMNSSSIIEPDAWPKPWMESRLLADSAQHRFYPVNNTFIVRMPKYNLGDVLMHPDLCGFDS